jgi:hypothetical protein
MKKKIILGTVLTLSLLIITIVVTISTTLAASNPSKPLVKIYFNGGGVVLQLPPAPNATSPAPPGTPTHPVNLIINAFDQDRRTDFGAADHIAIRLWIPQVNAYIPVAVINDNPNPAGIEFRKMVYNNTPIWSNTSWLSGFENVITVADKDLDIWTESTCTYYGSGNKGGWNVESSYTLIMNLTKSVIIKLPYDALPSYIPPSKWGNLTFTLPPMTLTFHEIGDSFPRDEPVTIANSPYGSAFPYSGYTVTTKSTETPSWVEVKIPAWLGGANILEVTGHMSDHGTLTFVPPA